MAERQQHRKTAQRLGTEGCQCVRLQTKRDKSRVAMSGQVRRDACESQHDESHECSGSQKATCWSYVTQFGIPYWAATTRLGIAEGEYPVTIVWTIRCSGCLQATNTSGRCFAAKDPRGFLHENAGIYKFLQNAEPLCGKMRGFAGICKAQFVLFGTFCGKMRGFVNASQSL